MGCANPVTSPGGGTKANLIAAAVGAVLLAAYTWAVWTVSGNHREAKILAGIKRDTVVVHDTLPSATVVSPAVVRPARRESPPPLASLAVHPLDLPWPSVYALDTVVAVSDSNVSVSIPLSVEFDPRTRNFDIQLQPSVTYSQPKITISIVERRDPWYLRPLAALGTGAAVYGILKENEVIAGIGGAVAFYSLVIEIP